MLLVLLPTTILILLCYLVHDRKQKVRYLEDDLIAVVSIIGIILVSILLACSGTISITSSCGYHYEEHVKLINARPVIIAEINSKDATTRNQGITDAVAYNQAVKAGKERLDNIWTNWLTDRIWTDAEYIDVNVDEYEIISESECAKDEKQ